jgi:hypothetical protein
MDHGNAVCASDWGWGVVVDADDGEPGSQRRSCERWRLEQGKLSGKEMCKCQGVC